MLDSISFYYYIPYKPEIKLIDFGCAITPEESHIGLINTRQYRAPEVILGGVEWDTKSDIWSIGCLLFELYTSNLLFSTHEEIEHLSLIEKLVGPIPLHMILNSNLNGLQEVICQKEIKKIHKQERKKLKSSPVSLNENRIKYSQINDLIKKEKIEKAVLNYKKIEVSI